MRRLHKWGGANIAGLAAPPLTPLPPGYVNAQHSISLAFPLSSRPDEIVKAASAWPHPSPNERVLKYLGGASAGSPRLRLCDRTVHQPVYDFERATEYATNYGQHAAMRGGAGSTRLPPLAAERVSERPPRHFGVTSTTSLPTLPHAVLPPMRAPKGAHTDWDDAAMA